MAAPKNARSKGRGKRWYVWNAPGQDKTERYWSVTSIISGGIPKPQLTYWAAKEAAKYATENLEHIQGLVNMGELGVEQAVEVIKKAPWKKSGKAADLGTSIHEAIEAWVLDKPLPDWSEEVEPYMEAAIQWLSDFEPKVEASEASVYSRTYRYAGTLDMIATIGDRLWLIDFKTGSGVYPEAALQMSAYANADFIGLPDGTEGEMPMVDAAAVVHVQPNSYEFIPVSIEEPIFKSFLYCREVFRWMEDLSKEAIHPAVPSLAALQQRQKLGVVAS